MASKQYAPRTVVDGLQRTHSGLIALKNQVEELMRASQGAWAREEIAGAKLDAIERFAWDLIIEYSQDTTASQEVLGIIRNLAQIVGIDPADWKYEQQRRENEAAPIGTPEPLPANAPKPPPLAGRVQVKGRPFERPALPVDIE